MDEEEAKEDSSEMINSAGVESLRLVSPTYRNLPINHGATVVSTDFQSFLEALSETHSTSSTLATLQAKAASRTLPFRSLNCAEVDVILGSCSLSNDREHALFLLLRESCLALGTDILLLESGSCIDHNFPLEQQKGK
jgi:hypothetical protein